MRKPPPPLRLKTEVLIHKEPKPDSLPRLTQAGNCLLLPMDLDLSTRRRQGLCRNNSTAMEVICMRKITKPLPLMEARVLRCTPENRYLGHHCSTCSMGLTLKLQAILVFYHARYWEPDTYCMIFVDVWC